MLLCLAMHKLKIKFFNYWPAQSELLCLIQRKLYSGTVLSGTGSNWLVLSNKLLCHSLQNYTFNENLFQSALLCVKPESNIFFLLFRGLSLTPRNMFLWKQILQNKNLQNFATIRKNSSVNQVKFFATLPSV